MSDSIAWWGWLAIWLSLVIAALVALGLLAWWLFRKFMRLIQDASDLAARAEVLEWHELELPRPAIAVLAEARDIRRREDARQAHRSARSRHRLADRLSRAKRITSVDATKQTWPASWYQP